MCRFGCYLLLASLLLVLPAYSQQATAVHPAVAPLERTRPAQQLTFEPYRASGIYNVGDTVGWTVTPGPTPPTYSYRYTIRRNNAVVLKQGNLDLAGGKTTIEISGDQPEMLYVAVEPYALLPTSASAASTQKAAAQPDRLPANASDVAARSVTDAAAGGQPAASPFHGGNTGRDNGLYALGAGVAPLQIGMDTPRPADFDAFWDAELAEQARVPIHPVLTPVPGNTPGVDLQSFNLDALGSHAQGYIAKPAKKGKYPALIQLQYAGVYALNPHADEQRAASGWLVINVDSHDKKPEDPSGGIPNGYQAIGNTSRETSYFLRMYLRDARALDYLFTRPDWDGKTIVITGGSMGGQQSLALAGLRPQRITAVLVCVPSGADTNGDLHGRKAGYPNWPSDNAEAMKTALYFDPVNFASRIKAPVMAGMGFIDTTSPPAGIWTMLNQIAGAKEPLPMIWSNHDNMTPMEGHACPARVDAILHEIVQGGTYTPQSLRP